MPDGLFEKDDIIIGNARRWGKVLVLFIIFGSGLAMGFFFLFAAAPFHAAKEIANENIRNGLLPQDNASTRLDIAALRAHEREILEKEGLSVVHPGAKRIRIEEAMARLAASGLPARRGAPTPPPDPLPADVLNHGAP